MTQVKTAVLALLLDAYRRRDKVGLVTFRGRQAELALPPTRSVDIAAVRLAELPAGTYTVTVNAPGFAPVAQNVVVSVGLDTTADFAIETGIDLPRFAIVTPFPGTPLHQRLAQQERILTRNWELYDGQHVVFEPRHMTPAELAAGHEQAWKKVYRYSAIARRLWTARTFEPLGIAANLGYRFYAHHLHRFYTCDWAWSAAAVPAAAPAR